MRKMASHTPLCRQVLVVVHGPARVAKSAVKPARDLAGDGGLVVAWWFEVDGRGVFVEAGLPANGFERSWDVVDEIVRSTRRLEER